MIKINGKRNIGKRNMSSIYMILDSMVKVAKVTHVAKEMGEEAQDIVTNT